MPDNFSPWLYAGLLLVLANWPFVQRRLFVFFDLPSGKSFAFTFLEWGVCALFALLAGMMLEIRTDQWTVQGWAFYVTFLCIFLSLSFPGFVYAFLFKTPVNKPTVLS